MTHPDAHHPRATHVLIPVPFGPSAAPGAQVWAGDLWVAGWTVAESTGAAAATFQIIDGNDALGIPAGPPITLAAGADKTVMLGGHLLQARTGFFVRVITGSVTGVLYAADKN